MREGALVLRRWLALWAVLFAVHGATLGVDELRTSSQASYLSTADALVNGGEVAEDAPGLGFPLLIAPAYAVGGEDAVQLFMAAVAALAFVLAVMLARRIVPEPWATRAALLLGVSAPALAYGATVSPDLAAGAVLCGAVGLALRVREDPRRLDGLLAAALVATLPWLGTPYAIAGIPVLLALVHWTMRHGRRTLGLLEVEVVAASLVAFGTVNDVLFGAFVPEGGTAGASSVIGYLERVPRLLTVWVDPEDGLIRWAPAVALAFVGAYLLARSRRERLARLAPARRDTEVAAILVLLVCGAQLLTVAFALESVSGPWFGPRHIVPALPLLAALAAWGLRWTPRWGALLGALTLAGSAWLAVFGES